MQMEAATEAAQATGEVVLETIPKFPFLVGAYSAFFLILFVYIVTLHRRAQRMERELKTLANARP